MNCSFCQSSNLEEIYKPIRSKIGLEVLLCKTCGLVQSKSKKRSKKIVGQGQKVITRLSCDADYSDVRVGKAQMVAEAQSLIKQIDKSEINKVLDICSARGDFARFALSYFNIKSIDCLDPDKYMTLSYKDDPRINLTIGIYSDLKISKKYDLIYSCHTLEHYRNPAKKLAFMVDNITDEKYLLLDVPNIETISDNRNIDEFFYDHHRFYFNRELLTNFLLAQGMELISENESLYSIKLLMKKTGRIIKKKLSKDYTRFNKELIRKYYKNIQTNRNKLPEAVRMINKIIINKKNAIIGCGRIFDALITYGGLDINSFNFLIDNFLINASKKLYGKKLYTSDILKAEPVDNILLNVRSSTSNLAKELSKKFPNVNIISINDILDKINNQ